MVKVSLQLRDDDINNQFIHFSFNLFKVIFEVAHRCAPSIIFIDEIDALTLRRSLHEHEASRRMKSEIFARMDALCQSQDNVFFLATTNTPWYISQTTFYQIFIDIINETILSISGIWMKPCYVVSKSRFIYLYLI